MKIGPDMKPYFVQYQASKAKKHLTLKQRSVPMIVIIVQIPKISTWSDYFKCFGWERQSLVEEKHLFTSSHITGDGFVYCSTTIPFYC